MLLLLPFSCAGKTTRIPIFGASPTTGDISSGDNGVTQVPKLPCKDKDHNAFQVRNWCSVLFVANNISKKYDFDSIGNVGMFNITSSKL